MRAGPTLTAVLATLVAGAAVLAMRARAAGWETVLDSTSLPWGAIQVDGPLASAAPPAALLYVQPSCAHCDSATAVFINESRRAGVEPLVISASRRAEAEDYRKRFNLERIATDSAREFARAAGIRFVPTLGRLLPGDRLALAPIPRPALIAVQLRAGTRRERGR